MKMDRLIGILSILLQREQVTAPEPVSYTHLDVYKRQSHEGASDSFVIEDVDDPTMAVELTRITCEALRKAASQKRRK